MEYKIKLSAKDVELIGAALATLPYGQVVLLINHIQYQIAEQEKHECDDVT